MTNEEQFKMLQKICDQYPETNGIDPSIYNSYKIKRGLREPDGTGTVVGATRISSVRGYYLDEGERIPQDGHLYYRGYDINDLLDGFEKEDRFGFEETVYLLLIGRLPNAAELKEFTEYLASLRELPEHFTSDMIIKAPSPNIMNKMERSVLSMYSYDDNPDDTSLKNILRQSLLLISRLPAVAVNAYQVKKRYYDKESMYLHFQDESLSAAENFLHIIRPDKQFTHAEARLLDSCMILHAEHGAGNNSAFACRCLASTGTDTYSCISAAIGSLKGPRHGGANIAACQMIDDLRAHIGDLNDKEEISAYLKKILRKEAGDGSGLIYGMGHAVYTLSDPRAIQLKKRAAALAADKGMEEEFRLIESVEELAPAAFREVTGNNRPICANVDLYSGFVYRMLNIPSELYTPMFALSRIAGWCAHRVEEWASGSRIMRPAYRFVEDKKDYLPLTDR